MALVTSSNTLRQTFVVLTKCLNNFFHPELCHQQMKYFGSLPAIAVLCV